jgi:hypothetical protein
MLVITLGLDPKDALKMARLDDEQLIETLRSDGPDDVPHRDSRSASDAL